jgi:hypothetical protein
MLLEGRRDTAGVEAVHQEEETMAILERFGRMAEAESEGQER